MVEIITVLGIMSVLVGLLSPAISLMFSKDARAAAQTIQGGLDTLRSYSMSKQGDWQLEIEKDIHSSNYFMILYKDGLAVQTTNLGKRIEITTPITGSFKIQYKPSNGSVHQVDTGAGWESSSDVITIHIEATRSRNESTINIIKLTGRHYIVE